MIREAIAVILGGAVLLIGIAWGSFSLLSPSSFQPSSAAEMLQAAATAPRIPDSDLLDGWKQVQGSTVVVTGTVRYVVKKDAREPSVLLQSARCDCLPGDPVSCKAGDKVSVVGTSCEVLDGSVIVRDCVVLP